MPTWRCRRGRATWRTRSRACSTTTIPCFAAAAVHFIVQRRLWALTGDIEYVLGHRSTDGHAAVEAASWALRIRVPAVPRRVSRSRSWSWRTACELIPLFEFVAVDELFRVAAAGEEARHAAGRELFHPGDAPDHMEFLIEGAVRMIQPSGIISEIEAPAVLGLEDVLQGAPPTVTIRAVEPVVCFRIGAGAFMTMVSGNALLAQSLFQMLLAQCDLAGRETPAADPRDTTTAARPDRGGCGGPDDRGHGAGRTRGRAGCLPGG